MFFCLNCEPVQQIISKGKKSSESSRRRLNAFSHRLYRTKNGVSSSKVYIKMGVSRRHSDILNVVIVHPDRPDWLKL